jgi:serine/threonine-protein kinase
MSDEPAMKPERLSLEDADRVDQVCDRFEAAWRAGGRPRIEDFLGDASAAIRTALLHELLSAELERRLRQGERPGPGEYLDRFPGYSALIGRVLDDLGLADQVGSHPSGDSGNESTQDGSLPARGSAGSALPVIPGYEVLAELGRGGMGVVYKARELRLNRVVALKMILAGVHASPEARLRFLNEAEVIARRRHPVVVQIYGMGDHEGHPYIELEYVGGRALAASLDGTPWPWLRAAGFMEVLARAVHEAHRQGVVHRDLKPANVLLTEAGEPKIADFGLAKLVSLDAGLTRTDSVLGTPSYMAPEQAEGRNRDVGPAADVYALGAIFYELLTGRPPFKAATAQATLDQVRTSEPVRPSRVQPGLPRDAETVCLKCLEKDARRRYHSAGELADDLRRFRACEPVRARPVGPVGRAWRWCVREPRVAGLVASLALVVLAGFSGVSWQWRRAEAEASRARRQAEVAQQARARADANFQRAQVLVEDLTRSAEGMAGQPRLEKARRALLERLMDFHLEFLKEKSDDPKVLWESALAFGRVARIRSELDQNDRATDGIRRQGDLLDRLLSRDPTNPTYRSARAACHYVAARYQLNKESRLEAARDSYDRAIAIQEELVNEFPREASYRGVLSIYLTNWANLRRLTGDVDAAVRVFPRIIQLGRDCLSHSAGNHVYRRDLAISLDEYGQILWMKGRRGEAEAVCREA